MMLIICYVVEICLIGFFFNILDPIDDIGDGGPSFREKLPMLIIVGIMTIGFGIFTTFATIELIRLLK